MKVNDAIRLAKNELGVTEFPANSNNVKYNVWFYGKMVQGAGFPWCAVFISYIFRDAQDLVKKTASCLDMLEWFEAHNRIVTHPQPGDIVFFHYSTNKRRTNHVGIIVSVADSNHFTTIEGNTSIKSNDNGGAVMERQRTRANVVAFARPLYEDLGDYHPTLRRGAKGESVELLQELLNVKGFQVKIDGDFGVLTESAVKEFQKANRLVVDGVVGPETWKKLKEGN